MARPDGSLRRAKHWCHVLRHTGMVFLRSHFRSNIRHAYSGWPIQPADLSTRIGIGDLHLHEPYANRLAGDPGSAAPTPT
jgi:hypothetical protein